MAEEYLETGDPRFLDELCRIHDADRLGSFGVSWFNDKRPAARRFLFEYLNRPLATFRHEPLIKRMFKAADAAGDDEVMASFLVALDRTVRRKKHTRHRYDWSTRESWTEDSVRVPSYTEIPKDKRAWSWHPANPQGRYRRGNQPPPEAFLFSLSTRKYLRRRAWRYFRKLGQADPQRYVASIVKALELYTDDDCRDGLAFIDNWGLIHILFHETRVLKASVEHWQLVEDESLGNLEPAPAFADAWKTDARPLLELLSSAKCRAVRQWTIAILKQHHASALAQVSLSTLQAWLKSDDESLADLAIDGLQNAADIGSLTAQDWLQTLEEANSHVVGQVTDLMKQHLSASRLTLSEKINLACSRTVVVAQLGADWLNSVQPSSSAECVELLAVAEAEADVVRGQLVNSVRQKIQSSPHFDPRWVMELLDSRREDVREVGWQWLNEDERATTDTTNWQRLMETPYDDIQLRMVKLLERESTCPNESSTIHQKKLDEKLLRSLWASVLLNVHRGGRQKPGVVAGIIDRLQHYPGESAELLPLLGVALRSVRTVEWRAALSGLVRLVDAKPELAETIKEAFPELSIA